MLRIDVASGDASLRQGEPNMLALTPDTDAPNTSQAPLLSTTPTMTAAEVGHIVGSVDLDTARRHHVEMTAVIAELARNADIDWPWTHDDPTVAVLRALAKLSLSAPDALSERAIALCQRIVASDASADIAPRMAMTS